MIGIKDQYFGTEIEMTGITRQRAAEVVAEMFGTEAYYDGTTYGVWSVIDLEGKKWKFMSDGSIYTQRKVYGRIVDAGGEYSTEMVSPKLSYDEMGKLQEVVRCLRQHGGFVNESCGQHVHVDASNHTPQSLKNALTIMYAKEDVLKLINNLIRNTTPKGAQSSDPFWEKSETALLQALMLYLLHEAPPEEQNFPMIMEMLGSAQVKEDDEDYQSPLDILFERLEMRDPESIAVKQYAIYKQAAGDICSK